MSGKGAERVLWLTALLLGLLMLIAWAQVAVDAMRPGAAPPAPAVSLAPLRQPLCVTGRPTATCWT